jgi:hypothetical protein
MVKSYRRCSSEKCDSGKCDTSVGVMTKSFDSDFKFVAIYLGLFS